jgi:hypothetical protein
MIMEDPKIPKIIGQGPSSQPLPGFSPLPPRKKIPYNKQLNRSPEEMQQVEAARKLILGRKVDYRELDTPIKKLRTKGDAAVLGMSKVEDRESSLKPLNTVKEGFVFKRRVGRARAAVLRNVLAKQKLRK